MCTRKLKNRSDHATFHVVFIHFEPDEKKEVKRRRLKNTCVLLSVSPREENIPFLPFLVMGAKVMSVALY